MPDVALIHGRINPRLILAVKLKKILYFKQRRRFSNGHFWVSFWRFFTRNMRLVTPV